MPYFDHNATTPLRPIARDAWLQAQSEAWQNPAGPYRDAVRVKLRMDTARETLATMLGAAANRLVFTSGATEAANAVAAYLAHTLPREARVAINPTEHPCVLAAFTAAFAERLVSLPLTANGEVTSSTLTRLLETSDGMGRIGAVVTMAANNETGLLQPWIELAPICRKAGVVYVCDASQWLGKLPAGGLGEADWVFGSAHKFGGPKGIGLLQRATQADGFRGQLGGEQQRGHRGGTEDFPAVASLVAALAEAEKSKVVLESDRIRWRDEFERRVQEAIPGTLVIGAKAERLWNTVMLSLPNHDNERWVARLDKRGFQVSTGSACATGKAGPSHVLAALGVAPERIRRSIRVSSGWETTLAEWRALADAFPAVNRELAESAPVTVRI